MSYQRLPTLNVEALNERVCQTLREAIINGVLRPGERLVEDRIAEQMGVSRAPIREALMILEREGLVRSLPRRGMIVSVLSKHDVDEIYSLRSALECQAGREAAKRISPQDLEELDALVRKIEQSALGNEGESLVAQDIAFHRAILEISGNRRLLEAWLGIMSLVRMLRRYVMESPDTNVGRIAHQHGAIIDALRSGNPDRVERCLRDHVESVSHQIFESFPKVERDHRPLTRDGREDDGL